MVKLSRTGWNNVIIFAVMGFILLINVTQQNSVFEPTNNQQALLAEHSVILSLTINQHTNIERIGKTWRALPAVISGQPLEAMMETWQQLQGQLISKPATPQSNNMVMVSLVLAGQEHDEYLMLFPNDDGLIIFQQSSQQYYQFPNAIFSQLIPREVL